MSKFKVLLVALLLTCIPTVYSDIDVDEVRHQHNELPNGGYTDIYTYADGQMQTIVCNPCPACYRTGKCQMCFGTGRYLVGSGMYASYMTCMGCMGKGTCHACGGEGDLVIVGWSNLHTGEYVAVSNGGHAAAGVARSNEGSSGSNSGSTGGSGSSAGSDNGGYYEKKVYAPDYTGRQRQVWCDKCRTRDYPHAHVKVRI